MQSAFLPDGPRNYLPIRVLRWRDRIFIECDHGAALLRYLGILSEEETQTRYQATWLRGVLIPGEGAFLEIYDSLGTCLQKPFVLSEDEFAQRVTEKMIGMVMPDSFTQGAAPLT